MASPLLAVGLAIPALFLLGGKDKGGGSGGKKGGKSSSMVDLDEFDR